MSNALAIASVTAVLKNLLDNGMIDADFKEPVKVSVSPPDRILTGDTETAQLNLFLYSIARNIGWSNVGLPSRDERGDRVSNPPLALDLYYMLSAYESGDFDAEVLLGFAMQILHETPILDRTSIRTALAGGSVSGAALPAAFTGLNASDLADQAEQIMIAPHRLDVDEMSKLWTAFQAKYRPSVAYHVSVVLIEGNRPVRSPLPVLSRGQPIPAEGRDEGVAVQPDLLPAFPTLFEVTPPSGQPAFRMRDPSGMKPSEVLRFTGHHLDEGDVIARFTHIRSRAVHEVAADLIPRPTATEFSVTVPAKNPDDWQIGVYAISAAIKSGSVERMTNGVPLPLAPRATFGTAGESTDKTQWVFTVICTPKVWKGQSAALIVGEREISADPFEGEKIGELTFRTEKAGLDPGKYLARLLVDGMESLLIDRTVTPPVFDTDQMVTIPKVVTP